ncbi:MAG: TrmH family RNA methyltransferase [Alphaproteobacteria bacterium]|nr:TrmH family RNA methyltransferase [Alphaproteobacteria bacterium]MCD8525953.1 TrmH family RNA methyltransferase [Alphaproteobacteria bacterium]MCD8571075.1 TrmH family RNA methyltransferase [Alphaproteobacteria bacterium]
MRGYFGMGVEGISKEGNVGNLVRSSHSFGASFFFSIAPEVDIEAMRVSDTSGAFDHVPYYQYDSAKKLALPMECALVGIELTDDAVDLPSFRHPTRAAYVLGPEMGHLSQAMQDQCAHIIKIPMKFCVNVGVAGALVMYDRMLSMGRFAERPVRAGGPLEVLAPTQNGLRRKLRSRKKF